MNAMFRNSLTAYGVEELEFDADPSGTPTTLVGADQIIANIEMLLSTSAADNTASRMLQAVKGNPVVVIDVLAPESMILALALVRPLPETPSAEERLSQTGTTTAWALLFLPISGIRLCSLQHRIVA